MWNIEICVCCSVINEGVCKLNEVYIIISLKDTLMYSFGINFRYHFLMWLMVLKKSKLQSSSRRRLARAAAKEDDWVSITDTISGMFVVS